MRHRLRRSCDACYKRKIRCDADSSRIDNACDWCYHHNNKCSFSERKSKTNNATNDILPKVSMKPSVAQSERSIVSTRHYRTAASLNSLHTECTTTIRSVSSEHWDERRPKNHWCTVCQSKSGLKTPLGHIFHLGLDFGVICLGTGMLHLTDYFQDWIHTKTGLWPQFDAVTDLKPNSTTTTLPQGDDEIGHLPDRSVTDALFEEYISCDFMLIFPYLDVVLFREVIDNVYANQDATTSELRIAKASVYAFLALMGNYMPSQRADKYVNGDLCAFEAKRLLQAQNEFSLDELQATCLLLLLASLGGLERTFLKYHSHACQSVMAMGGHLLSMPTPVNGKLTTRQRKDRQLRLIFWLCYFFDKSIAVRIGQPPLINDDFCDLTLPEGYDGVRFGPRLRDPTDDCQMPLFPSDLHLCLLQSKVINTLYTAKSMQTSDAEVLRSVRELDEELEVWRLSVPPQYSPSLSVRNNVKLDKHQSRSASMHHIELHLTYHHMLHIIHSASNRISLGPVGAAENHINSGIQSSLDISVEASRSTMIYLNAFSDRIAAQAFFAFIFYPMSAMMALFIGVLRNPRHEYALHDVGILVTSSKLIRNMPRLRTTPFTKAYLKQVDMLVADIVKLAQAAIARAE